MATNNTKPVTESSKKAAKAKEHVEEVPTKAESTYSAAELAQAHHIFDTSYAIVSTALKLAGKETATVAEAKGIIEKFKNKEVK